MDKTQIVSKQYLNYRLKNLDVKSSTSNVIPDEQPHSGARSLRNLEIDGEDWGIASGSAPVTSVNGKIGAVVLNAADVHALSDSVETLPNPYSISITQDGTTTIYDGRQAKSLEINHSIVEVECNTIEAFCALDNGIYKNTGGFYVTQYGSSYWFTGLTEKYMDTYTPTNTVCVCYANGLIAIFDSSYNLYSLSSIDGFGGLEWSYKPDWIKQWNKPSYTAAEVHAVPDTTTTMPNPHPINITQNGQTVTYDGTSEKSIEITGGGGSSYRREVSLETVEDFYALTTGYYFTGDYLEWQEENLYFSVNGEFYVYNDGESYIDCINEMWGCEAEFYNDDGWYLDGVYANDGWGWSDQQQYVESLPEWIKQPDKPTYTAAEVGALPDTTTTLPNPHPINIIQNGTTTTYDGTSEQTIEITGGGGGVTSVNGKTGVVVLDAEDVGALPDTTIVPTVDSSATYGLQMVGNEIRIKSALQSEVQALTDEYKPITPYMLNIGVQTAMLQNWTMATNVNIAEKHYFALERNVGLINSSNSHTIKSKTGSGTFRGILIVSGNTANRSGIWLIITTPAGSSYAFAIGTAPSQITVTTASSGGGITVTGTSTSNSYGFIIGLDGFENLLIDGAQ